MKTIDARIKALETRWSKKEGWHVPGTMITRVLNPNALGMEWCLSVGGYGRVKAEFRDQTIEGCLRQAEKVR